MIICQFMFYLFMLSTATEVLRFNYTNLAKEIVFSLTCIFILANLFHFSFEAPVSNLLKKYILNKIKFNILETEDLAVQKKKDQSSPSKAL